VQRVLPGGPRAGRGGEPQAAATWWVMPSPTAPVTERWLIVETEAR
jgi:hypothetical protein